MTFGSILEGPNTHILKPLVEQAMPVLIERLKDPSIIVEILQPGLLEEFVK